MSPNQPILITMISTKVCDELIYSTSLTRIVSWSNLLCRYNTCRQSEDKTLGMSFFSNHKAIAVKFLNFSLSNKSQKRNKKICFPCYSVLSLFKRIIIKCAPLISKSLNINKNVEIKKKNSTIKIKFFTKYLKVRVLKIFR